MGDPGFRTDPPTDYALEVKRVRGWLGLTQQQLADRLGVSFATVNRWENEQSRPSPLSWQQLESLIREIAPDAAARGEEASEEEGEGSPLLDFTSRPEVVRTLAEGERLSFGHMANPTFATEVSLIDPLPHQRIAVYDYMLEQPRLRFLLADDAGAGKTIMSGLYVREMLSRRLLTRVLIVPPAGLVGNWESELATLFNMPFRIVEGSDARVGNPFVGDDSSRVIVSVDTLAGPRVFSRLQEPDVQAYDLVVFDEAHKLAADRGGDFRVRKTDRYRLAEALAGVRGLDSRWHLGWSTHHLLLLTATPHMGKAYPYYALWRLLEPEVLSTPEAFAEYPRPQKRYHFIRRTKEEMVRLDGSPLYPTRISDTLGYELTQGEVSEQQLYDETTEYLRYVYNRAKLLNRSAARLAMGVFQRRLASSTYALLRSFERRIDKLERLIADVQEGRITMEQLITLQQRITEDYDVLDAKAADDESPEDGREENEASEEELLKGVIAASLADLIGEKEEVEGLRDLAREVYELGTESKFERLREVAADARFRQEKMIIFSEHRDTLDFLFRRLCGMGFTGQIAQVHGGMDYKERQKQVEHFRKPAAEGGARFLVATDAAGEGINLQFCWLMINYDVPWNPARLEQRMGRIHRYGQKHDPVIILNLVAPTTREGHVLETLLKKLDKIREELSSDKVFDAIGRIFEGISIKQYMDRLLEDSTVEDVEKDLDTRLTKDHVEEVAAQEQTLYGPGGDVAKELPRLQADLDQEMFCRLLPGYMRRFIADAAPLVGMDIDGDLGGCFALRPSRPGALDPLLTALDHYPIDRRQRLSVVRPENRHQAVWLHPGEPVFERFCGTVRERLGRQAERGAVFVDPTANTPYLFHLALLTVVRRADSEVPQLAQEEVLDCRLVGIRQAEGAEVAQCPVEHLLLLKDGQGLPGPAQRLALAAQDMVQQARAYLLERVGRQMAVERRKALLDALPEREGFLRRGYDFHEADLAAARAKQSEKARDGNKGAQLELTRIKGKQRDLTRERDEALLALRREPELIGLGDIRFIAHALVVPSTDPADKEQHDAQAEAVAMAVARAFEEAAGAVVQDVHTPPLARAAGLNDNPGFDLLATRPSGEKRCIEVKGRAGTGEVEVSDNEWSRACNLRERYWLYAVYDCATPKPQLVRVQDPFMRLLAKAKGSVLIGAKQILEAAVKAHGQ